MLLCRRSDITESLEHRQGPQPFDLSYLRRGLDRFSLLAPILLALATLAAHGWAIGDGLFLDDHLHQLRLQDNRWSWPALLDATTVRPTDFIDTWWQEKPVAWQYTRPVSIVFAKVVYHLSGGSVKALHAMSIGLHWATACMVSVLCLWLTRRRFWSIVGGLLFVVYSHSVYAVGWLAAQNGVLQTALTLAAVLAYIRASGLDVYAGQIRNPLATAKPLGVAGQSAIRNLNPGWFTATMLLWVLALFSRESAVVLPVFLAALDWAFGGRAQVRARLNVYLLMAAAAVSFSVWRLWYCDQPMPDFYVRRPDGPEYILWWLAKLMHYLTAAVWLSPMTIGPSGRFNPFREVPGDCLLMLAILGIMGAGYYLACRRARGYWLWPLWMLLSLLPVVPVMATPHSGYMPGVGFAVAMILGAALRDRIAPVGIGKWSRPVALWFLIATCTYVPIYRTMWNSVKAAERYTMAGVMQLPPPREAGDLFFINLPFVNIYAQLNVHALLKSERGLDEDDPRLHSRAHVLTYSPNLLRVDQPCRLEQIDEHSFRVSIEGRPYFSGALGRFLIEGMRGGPRFQTGESISGELFDVRIADADEHGVRELVFRFHEPLASPKYCFYLTTDRCGAVRVKFRGATGAGPVNPQAGQDDEILEAVRQFEETTGTLRDQRDALFHIRGMAKKVIQTDLYLTGPPFPDPR